MTETYLNPPADPIYGTQLAVIGSLIGSVGVGLGGAIGGAILGGIAAQIANDQGEIAVRLSGSLATAMLAVLFGRGLAKSIKPVPITAIWILAALALSGLLSWYVEREHFDWPVYRWALGGAAIGIIVGSFSYTIYLARGSPVDDHGSLRILVGIGVILGAIVSLVCQGRVAYLFACVIGGGIGGLGVAAIIGQVGGKEAVQLFGSHFTIPLSGAVLGAIAGGCGGWRAASLHQIWQAPDDGAENGIVHEAPSS